MRRVENTVRTGLAIAPAGGKLSRRRRSPQSHSASGETLPSCGLIFCRVGWARRLPLFGDRVRTRVEVLDESRAGRCPAEQLPRRGARRREIHAEEGADPPEMTLDVIKGDRCDGEAEGAADGLRDVPGGY